MRIIGGLMSLYAIGMLVLLATPAREWALEHSIASLVSSTDRRVGNTVEGAVDMPMAIAGSAVVAFAGLWFAIFVPWIIARKKGEMEALVAESMRARSGEQAVSGPVGGGLDPEQ